MFLSALSRFLLEYRSGKCSITELSVRYGQTRSYSVHQQSRQTEVRRPAPISIENNDLISRGAADQLYGGGRFRNGAAISQPSKFDAAGGGISRFACKFALAFHQYPHGLADHAGCLPRDFLLHGKQLIVAITFHVFRHVVLKSVDRDRARPRRILEDERVLESAITQDIRRLAKSSSVSVGKPTMKSLAMQMSAIIARGTVDEIAILLRGVAAVHQA